MNRILLTSSVAMTVLVANIQAAAAGPEYSRVDPGSTYYSPGMVPIGMVSATKPVPPQSKDVRPLVIAALGNNRSSTTRNGAIVRTGIQTKADIAIQWSRLHELASVLSGSPEALFRISRGR